MIVELALLAVVPGALTPLHYAVQALRPRWLRVRRRRQNLRRGSSAAWAFWRLAASQPADGATPG